MTQLYVYYKLPESGLAAAVAAAQAMQARLAAAHPGLRCGLLRRPGLRNGEVTLMETYAGAVTPELEVALGVAAQATAALPAGRQVERFEPLT
jgi:hypothetical protein